MRLAIDGGAFQQGIAAGIYNVAVGLMNAIAQARQDATFILVADPRLGPVRDDLVARLSTRPQVVEGRIGPAYRTNSQKMTTADPDIRFEVDGAAVPAAFSDGEAVYVGPAPTRSFRLLSRADSPAAAVGGGDGRRLGIAIDRIAIRTQSGITALRFDDGRLNHGFHASEANLRWTDGAAALPLRLFDDSDGRDVEVTVGVVATMHYRLLGGAFDRSFGSVADQMERISLTLETSRVEQKLIEHGALGYIANHFIPARFHRLPCYALLYDMIPIVHPEFFYADARANFDANVSVFKAAKHVFSISDASRQDLIRLVGVPPDRVTVTPIDVDPTFVAENGQEIVEARQRYGLSARPYILTVGTLEPRKNHSRLIEAYSSVVQAGAPSCDLAIVGNHGWGTDSLFQQVARLGLTSRVHFLTSVPNEDLVALYSGALFCAYPSLYEGFGLPVLEAMACGCPVMTSDRSSMPEVAGEAALLIDPTSVSAITQGLYRMITNARLRQRLVTAGLEQRQRFSWATSADRILRVLEGH